MPRLRRRYDLIGWAGAAIGLAGYVVVDRVFLSDSLYIASSVMLGYDAGRRRAWPFVAINAVWGLISIARILT